MSDSLRPHGLQYPGFPVHHQPPELTQTHVRRVGDAIQLSHALLSPSLHAFNFSQHQGLFKWVSSLHQVAKVLEIQLKINPLRMVITNFTYITSYFMKNNYIFQSRKKKLKEWHCFTSLHISLMSDLIEDSWTLISASAFNLHIKIHIHYELLLFLLYSNTRALYWFSEIICEGWFFNLRVSLQASKGAWLNICCNKRGGRFCPVGLRITLP